MPILAIGLLPSRRIIMLRQLCVVGCYSLYFVFYGNAKSIFILSILKQVKILSIFLLNLIFAIFSWRYCAIDDRSSLQVNITNDHFYLQQKEMI